MVKAGGAQQAQACCALMSDHRQALNLAHCPCPVYALNVIACKYCAVPCCLVPFNLQADVGRWCCSGTPISTEVTEFIGQFNFLGVTPFNNKTFFNSEVGYRSA